MSRAWKWLSDGRFFRKIVFGGLYLFVCQFAPVIELFPAYGREAPITRIHAVKKSANELIAINVGISDGVSGGSGSLISGPSSSESGYSSDPQARFGIISLSLRSFCALQGYRHVITAFVGIFYAFFIGIGLGRVLFGNDLDALGLFNIGGTLRFPRIIGGIMMLLPYWVAHYWLDLQVWLRDCG